MSAIIGQAVFQFPKSYTVIDVETTGYDPAFDQLIEVAALKVHNKKIIDCFSSLIHIDCELNKNIVELTGITNDDLSCAPDAHTVLKQFADFVDTDILLGHSVPFDIHFLNTHLKEKTERPLPNDYIDTFLLCKKYCPDAESFKLTDLARSMDIPVETAHRALDDCFTTHFLYQKLAEKSVEE